jgi:spore germination protein
MCFVNRSLLLAAFCSFFLIAGCSPVMDNDTVEEIAPIIFWSIDEGRKGKLEMSTLVPPLTNEDQHLITEQANLLKEGGKRFNFSYYNELKLGQLRMLFINENVAKKGLMSIINTTFADPNISQRLFLVIVKGDFENFLKKQIGKEKNLDYYLYRMMKHYEEENKGEIRVVNLHEFMKQLYSSYSSPILPVFKVQGDKFVYEGTGIFKSDKLITTVKKMDNIMYRLLHVHDRYLETLPIPSLKVSLGHIKSKVERELSHDYSTLFIKVKLDGRIEEYSGNEKLIDPKGFATLKKQIESYLEKHSIELMKKMQQEQLDPLEIGTLTLDPFKKPISDKEWLEKWKNMKLVVDYQLYLEPLTNDTSNHVRKYTH